MPNIFIPSLERFYQQYPLVLVDIGASGGFADNWKSASRYLKVIGFEPDEREFLNLQKKNDSQVMYLNTALYNTAKEVKFYMSRKQQTSSVFEPNRDFLNQFPEDDRFDVLKVTHMRTDSLDHQVEVNHIDQMDFIKIDTEGSELFILHGASKTLDQHIFGAEVEVEYAPMHLGQPQFCDVDKWMQTKGFHLFDLKDYYWKRTKGKNLGKARGQIIFADALYLKTIPQTMSLIESIKDAEKRRAKILKILSICALYGYLDYAMEIFEGVRRQFDAIEAGSILDWLRNSQGWYSKIPQFPGRYKLSRLFYQLSEIFKPTYNGWASNERELGNKK